MPELTAAGRARPPDHQTIGLLWAVVVLRFAALAWATVVVAIDVNGVTELRAGLAVAALAALAGWSLALGWLVRRRPRVVASNWVLVLDVGLAALVAALDHVVYQGPHPQTFASVWPMSAAVVAGLLRGSRIGAAAGLLIGASSAAGTALALDEGLAGRWTSTIGTIVLLVVAGVLAGLVTVVLRRADAAEARADAREEVARRLHDGVLQTLAVVQRRSQDPDLVALAREQELDLRAFIGDGQPSDTVVPSRADRAGGRGDDLAASLREVLATVERQHGLRCELVIVDLPSAPGPAVVEALRGAVQESLANVVKHADATRAVVCLDVERHELLCTVNDDGVGFDPSTTAEGTGLRRSVRGRIDEVGGTVALRSRPGHGSEVEVRVPLGRNGTVPGRTG